MYQVILSSSDKLAALLLVALLCLGLLLSPPAVRVVAYQIPAHPEVYQTGEPAFVYRLSQHIVKTYHVSAALADAVVANTLEAAHRTRLPLTLLLAVAAVESSFQPYAQSKTGAVGLMQVQPAAHPELQAGPTELQQVRPNLLAGAAILQTYMQQTGGDLPRALQRYNGARHDRHAKYSHKVMERMREFRLVLAGQADA